jgi:hypothetical protein
MVKNVFSYIRTKSCKGIVFCLSITIGNAYANDGKMLSTEPRPLVPVTNYQWFMIGVAVTYTICLIIRARRRKARRKADNQI